MSNRTLSQAISISKSLVQRKANFGFCPVCERKTVFIEEMEWLRDHYVCFFCRSIPRNRALIKVLKTLYPGYREMKIHESSPFGPTSDKLRRACKDYTPTFFWPDVPPGERKDNVRCENIERMTFEDATFDMIITQDVMEHVLNPDRAFSEIARTLKPGGAHVFTAPYYYWKKTLVRAVETPEGIKHLEEEDYHGNPVDSRGALVVTEWGSDFVDFIYEHSGMTTTVYHLENRRLGIDGKFLEVFVSKKPER